MYKTVTRDAIFVLYEHKSNDNELKINYMLTYSKDSLTNSSICFLLRIAWDVDGK